MHISISKIIKFCYYFIDSVNTISQNYSTCTAKTSDGVSWKIENVTPASNGGYSRKITIDVNGDKEPNCVYDSSSCPDPDTYTVFVRNDGKVKTDDTYVIELLADPTLNK